MQLQLVYQHHPSKIPKLNIKSINRVVIMVTYILYMFKHFKMMRYILKNIIVYGIIHSYIIVVIMKGVARIIDKSTRYI